MPERTSTVPLIPRHSFVGSRLGGFRSVRRGEGSDVAGSRPYRPGDHFHAIDWKSSARFSSARGTDEFIVRERFADEMPKVVVVPDLRPEMALFPDEFPWLHKPAAIERLIAVIVASALEQRGLVGYLDLASHGGGDAGDPFWRAPRAQADDWGGDLVEAMTGYLATPFDAPADNVEQALRFLSVVGGTVPAGSFLFVISDFITRPEPSAWTGVVGRGWDVVPLVLQDPLWEQSFPPVDGVVMRLCEPGAEDVLPVRLGRRQAEERARANEERLRSIERELLGLGVDPVVVSSSEPGAVEATLLEWAQRRFEQRGHRP